LALVVADQLNDAVAEAAGRSDSAPAALAALHHFLDRPSVDLLRQVLGLK
jgi:MarR family transcriptional regulator, negative regulator of the multidrug operon emrRAB